MPVADSHPNLLVADQSLLVVIDMQDSLLRAVQEPERVMTNIRVLMQGATILGVPILATTQYAEKLGPLTSLLLAMLPDSHPPFDKVAFSCLASPAFASEVKRSGRKQIVVCGVEAHICVSQTAHDLGATDYQVHVVADAVSARTTLNWKFGLDKMKQSGILLSTTEMALYELLREAGTPAFREILKLVK